ncbi:janus kinase and microtubule-interacting protein 2-like isoform X1, partial [Lates japonicus]
QIQELEATLYNALQQDKVIKYGEPLDELQRDELRTAVEKLRRQMLRKSREYDCQILQERMELLHQAHQRIRDLEDKTEIQRRQIKDLEEKVVCQLGDLVSIMTSPTLKARQCELMAPLPPSQSALSRPQQKNRGSHHGRRRARRNKSRGRLASLSRPTLWPTRSPAETRRLVLQRRGAFESKTMNFDALSVGQRGSAPRGPRNGRPVEGGDQEPAVTTTRAPAVEGPQRAGEERRFLGRDQNQRW